MSQYKQTLNLPQTDFPMKANLPQREELILTKWRDISLYESQRQKAKGKKKFILHLGPPYANGHIHLGTATTTLLKDLIVKSKNLSGFDAPLIPGWDCHGLPIELNVEKKVGKPGQKISAAQFRLACREDAYTFIDIQREEFKRLGIQADWEHPYLTMDFHYEANIIRSLAKILEKGYVQKGYKPVYWCLDCASALAEAEVEYAEKVSPAIDVRFPVVDVKNFLQQFHISHPVEKISLPIWTTTPWTLPANQAVAVNPEIEYVLMATENHEAFLIAEPLKEVVIARYHLQNPQEIGKILGKHLEKLQLQHPFYDRRVPVILGNHVTMDTGTGAVHTAPGHGIDDYLMAKKYDLLIDNPVADNGCFKESTPLFAGVHVKKANEKVIAELRARDTLIHEETIKHSYPHCWRHKSPVIFRATPQWFINMDKGIAQQESLRTQVLNAIDKVEWIPDWGYSRIKSMIETRPDWCISRQRTWGVPLCLIIHKETGELHPEMQHLMEKIALKVEQKGIEAWYELTLEELIGTDAQHYHKINDTLDVWFDSGVSHECVLKKRPELHFPADIVLEGSDQHRGWFQSSLLTSVAMNHEASYKQVLTHGFIVDGTGRKMSKSIGNVILPEEIIKTLGADILRLWVASIDYRYDIAASKEILARTSETYRRIRNTARFLLANLHDFDPEENVITTAELLSLDRWILDRTAKLQEQIIAAYNSYQFHAIIQKLHQFCVNDLGGFYLDIIKDRQYTMHKNAKGRRSAQTVLYHIAQAFVRWLAPILSFTAEEIWQYLPGRKAESVLLTQWYTHLDLLPESANMNVAYWETIRSVRDAVNKEIEQKRNAGELGSALEAEVILYCDAQLQKDLSALETELKFVLLTSKALVESEGAAPPTAVATEIAGLRLVITPSDKEKCERCWHRVELNTDSAWQNICARCVENISEAGETRRYA